jgi:hypothetical protein
MKLNYSLPGYRAEAYADWRPALDNLRALGFQWMTLTPTFWVEDETPLRIDLTQSPSFDRMRDAALYAASVGMSVKFDPHLDFGTTLGSNPVFDWRRRMYFDPSLAYHEQVISPLAGILRDVRAAGVDAALTLGSELDVSLVEFPDGWNTVRRQASGFGIQLGHKINRGSLLFDPEILTALNNERGRLGKTGWGRDDFQRLSRAAFAYLGSLDFVSFSFYPSIKLGRNLAWWGAPTRLGDLLIVAGEFRRQLDLYKQDLRRTAGPAPEFAIGEFGIGRMKPEAPWEFDRAEFLAPDGSLRSEARELRRKYHLGMLECLFEDPAETGQLTYWTVDQYDILGSGVFGDDLLRRAVSAYISGGDPLALQASP